MTRKNRGAGRPGHSLDWYRALDHEQLAQLAFDQRTQIAGLHSKTAAYTATLRNTRRQVARLRFNAGLSLDARDRELLGLPRLERAS